MNVRSLIYCLAYFKTLSRFSSLCEPGNPVSFPHSPITTLFYFEKAVREEGEIPTTKEEVTFFIKASSSLSLHSDLHLLLLLLLLLLPRHFSSLPFPPFAFASERERKRGGKRIVCVCLPSSQSSPSFYLSQISLLPSPPLLFHDVGLSNSSSRRSLERVSE